MPFKGIVRQQSFRLFFGYCGCSKECGEKATQLHHKLSDTIINRKRFPLFIDSVFNACPINHNCHLTKPLPKISEHEAEVYEEYLEGVKNGTNDK
jgi:hypothetical protein